MKIINSFIFGLFEDFILCVIYWKQKILDNNILLNKDIMNSNIPILILLNKTVNYIFFILNKDIAISDSAKFKRIYNSINYNRLDKKRFLVMEISALKG